MEHEHEKETLYYKWEELPKGVVDIDEMFSMQKLGEKELKFYRDHRLPPVVVSFDTTNKRDEVFDKICSIII